MTRHRLTVVVAALVCPIAYLAFVVHFWLNVPNSDDWNALYLVSQSKAGHLTLGMLWAQHYEDRMFFPNLIFVGSGRLASGNEQAVIALSAGVFVATYCVFLRLCRTYLGHLNWPVVLFIGAVWFSFVDFGNALMAFQLAWFLVLAAFVGMLWLLLGRWPYRVPAAIAVAVIASFCTLQGLLLWPVGLLCVLWNREGLKTLVSWCSAAIVTVAIYFIGYSSTPTNAGNLFPPNLFGAESIAGVSFSYPFHHLGSAVTDGIAELGVPFPYFRQAAGVVILAAAVFVVLRSVQRRELLPIALIAFAALFDAVIIIGRLHFGYSGVTASRYSMPGLVMLLAIVLYGSKHLKSRQFVVVGVAAIAIQVGVSTAYGLDQAGQLRSTLLTARALVTAKPPPSAERGCYAFAQLYFYLTPDLPSSFVSTLRRQRLGVFTSPPGVSPRIPQCVERRP